MTKGIKPMSSEEKQGWKILAWMALGATSFVVLIKLFLF